MYTVSDVVFPGVGFLSSLFLPLIDGLLSRVCLLRVLASQRFPLSRLAPPFYLRTFVLSLEGLAEPFGFLSLALD